jgi:hypothetical protein
MSTLSWRKALIAPVALLLGLGGALVASTAANAADAGLTVTSPVNNSTTSSRTVTVTGSVYGGSTVIVYAADGSTVLARDNVGGSFGVPTPYSVTLPAYADSAPIAESIEVGGLYGGSGIPQHAVSFSLPAPIIAFAVVSPTAGQVEASRVVTFSGAGKNGSTVNVLDADGNRIPGTTAAVVSGGTWSTVGTYPSSAPVAQTVTVTQTTGASGDGSIAVSFTLPATAAHFAVSSPTEGQAVASRTVTFTGTGMNGSTVNVLDSAGNRIPGTTAAVVADGAWTTTGTYPISAPIAQTAYVNQVTGGSGSGEATVDFTLPSAVFSLTVTSPADGQTVASRTVTFTGTGTDGSTVNVLDREGNRIPGTTAAVVSDGIWSTTGTYAADAPAAQTVDVNQVTGGAGRGEVVVNFDLPTPTPPTAPATPTAPAAAAGTSTALTPGGNGTMSTVASRSLADTGSNITGWASLGAVLLAIGVATTLVLALRRRTA